MVTWNRKFYENLFFFLVASSTCYWPLTALLLRSRSCVWLIVFRSGSELKMPNVLKEVDAIQRSELDIKRAPMTAKLLIQLKCHNAGEKKTKRLSKWKSSHRHHRRRQRASDGADVKAPQPFSLLTTGFLPLLPWRKKRLHLMFCVKFVGTIALGCYELL